MSEQVRDWMQKDVVTVAPTLTLPELDAAFLRARVGGFPVVADGRLVGVVSRSDVVRRLSVEQSVSESLSDAYQDWTGMTAPGPSLEQIGARVGERIEGLHVADVMSKAPLTVAPDAPLAEAAALLVEHRVHRLPVVEGERLAGIVSSLDVARAYAKHAGG
jgi:CBS domain-containing protein